MPKVYVAVKALVENGDKFLVIEQKLNGKIYIDLPGGKVEYGESPYNTLIREVKEEVFLDIKIIKSIGIWWFFKDDNKNQIICNTFLCKSKNTNIDLTKNPANENITNYYWFRKEELFKLKNLPDDSLKELFKLI